MKTQQEIQQLVEEKIAAHLSDMSEKDKVEFLRALNATLDGKNLAKATEMTPAMVDQLYAHGYRLYDSGNYKEAQLVFAFLITLIPDRFAYYFALAACFHRQKMYRAAVSTYGAAYCFDRKNPLPFFHMSDCYAKLNMPKYALFTIGMVLNKVGNDPKFAKIKAKAELTKKNLLRELE